MGNHGGHGRNDRTKRVRGLRGKDFEGNVMGKIINNGERTGFQGGSAGQASGHYREINRRKMGRSTVYEKSVMGKKFEGNDQRERV